MPESTKKPLVILIYFVLALSTVIVFWQVRNFDFVIFDDAGYVSENLHVTTGIKTDNIIWAFKTGHAANWHPLTWLSLMLDCQLFGINPGWIHIVNLLLHIANTLLLFAVLKKMTDSLWSSAFVAAAFAIHPMHVESVVWIAERKDVLSTLFWLLTMAAYVAYIRHRNLFRYLLTIGLFACGLMAKPMLVTLPFVLLLLDYWPLNRFELQTVMSRDYQSHKLTPIRGRDMVLYRIIIEKVPFFVLAAASSVITFFAQRGGGAFNEVSLQSRLSNALLSYVQYIGKMLWPRNLAIFYPLDNGGFSFWKTSLCLLLLAAISFLVIRLGRRHKYLPVGWFWFLGTLIPVIGVVQVGSQAMADRYSYIPYIGLFIIIAWGLPEFVFGGRVYQKIVLGTSMVIVLSVFGICAVRQVSYWKNGETIFRHALEVTQSNYVAHDCLGNVLLRQDKIELAIQECTKALEIKPTWSYAHSNLGAALAKQGRYIEALEQFRQAVELKPDLAGARYNFGKALGIQGRFEEALEQFRQAIQLEPDWPPPMNDFAFVVAAHPEVKNRDVNEAIRLSRRTCELTNYRNAAFLSTLATIYACAYRFSEAARSFETALKLEPNSAPLHNGLGNALLSQGRFKEAIDQMKRSLEIEPNNLDAKNSLAWILATCPDSNMRNPSDAIRLAQEACSATNYKKASKLDTLGAAYASSGRFADAIETAEKALSVIDQSQPDLLSTIQSRLDLYKVSKPYILVLSKDESTK